MGPVALILLGHLQVENTRTESLSTSVYTQRHICILTFSTHPNTHTHTHTHSPSKIHFHSDTQVRTHTVLRTEANTNLQTQNMHQVLKHNYTLAHTP
ncbi:hypothetical protein FKM82_007624 [Ascaphus truei]